MYVYVCTYMYMYQCINVYVHIYVCMYVVLCELYVYTVHVNMYECIDV